MDTHKINSRIEWMFLAVAVVIAAWLMLLREFAPGYIPLDEPGIAGFVMVAVAALVIPVFGYSAAWFYKTVLWKLNPWSGCKDGWWMYGITFYSKSGSAPKPADIVGIFKLDHTGPQPEVSEGRGWEIAGNELINRRRWESNKVWFDKNAGRITVIYNLTADKEEDNADGLPTEYSGIIQGDITSQKTIMVPRRKMLARKKRTIEGNIQGFNQHRDLTGVFYSEILPRNINYTKTHENTSALSKPIWVNRLVSWLGHSQQHLHDWWKTEYVKISGRAEAEEIIKISDIRGKLLQFAKRVESPDQPLGQTPDSLTDEQLAIYIQLVNNVSYQDKEHTVDQF